MGYAQIVKDELKERENVMIPYFIFFTISIMFCYAGEMSYRHGTIVSSDAINRGNQKRYIRYGRIAPQKHKPNTIKKYSIYFTVSVLIVSALAGMRGYTVGTDIRVYGNDLFTYAHTVSLIDFIKKLPNIEPLYLALVDFSALFSEEAHILYFFTGIIIYSFIMWGLVAHGKNIPITLAWTGFLFLLYGDTFNAMRQCLAIALGFWGFHFLIEKRYLKLTVTVIVAFFFHNSAIIMVAIIGIYLILQRNNKLWVKALMILGILGGVYFFNEVLNTFIEVGLLDIKMMRYQMTENTGISILAILIRLPFLVAILLQREKFANSSNNSIKLFPLNNMAEADFYILLLFLEIFTVELSAFKASLYRISLYFVPYRYLSYARIVGIQKRQNMMVYIIALVVYYLIIFVYQNMIKGNNEIYPYVFWFIS